MTRLALLVLALAVLALALSVASAASPRSLSPVLSRFREATAPTPLVAQHAQQHAQQQQQQHAHGDVFDLSAKALAEPILGEYHPFFPVEETANAQQHEQEQHEPPQKEQLHEHYPLHDAESAGSSADDVEAMFARVDHVMRTQPMPQLAQNAATTAAAAETSAAMHQEDTVMPLEEGVASADVGSDLSPVQRAASAGARVGALAALSAAGVDPSLVPGLVESTTKAGVDHVLSLGGHFGDLASSSSAEGSPAEAGMHQGEIDGGLLGGAAGRAAGAATGRRAGMQSGAAAYQYVQHSAKEGGDRGAAAGGARGASAGREAGAAAGRVAGQHAGEVAERLVTQASATGVSYGAKVGAREGAISGLVAGTQTGKEAGTAAGQAAYAATERALDKLREQAASKKVTLHELLEQQMAEAKMTGMVPSEVSKHMPWEQMRVGVKASGAEGAELPWIPGLTRDEATGEYHVTYEQFEKDMKSPEWQDYRRRMSEQINAAKSKNQQGQQNKQPSPAPEQQPAGPVLTPEQLADEKKAAAILLPCRFNGPCPAGTTCVPDKKNCVTKPCPQVRCVDPEGRTVPLGETTLDRWQALLDAANSGVMDAETKQELADKEAAQQARDEYFSKEAKLAEQEQEEQHAEQKHDAHADELSAPVNVTVTPAQEQHAEQKLEQQEHHDTQPQQPQLNQNSTAEGNSTSGNATEPAVHQHQQTEEEHVRELQESAEQKEEEHIPLTREEAEALALETGTGRVIAHMTAWNQSNDEDPYGNPHRLVDLETEEQHHRDDIVEDYYHKKGLEELADQQDQLDAIMHRIKNEQELRQGAARAMAETVHDQELAGDRHAAYEAGLQQHEHPGSNTPDAAAIAQDTARGPAPGTSGFHYMSSDDLLKELGGEVHPQADNNKNHHQQHDAHGSEKWEPQTEHERKLVAEREALLAQHDMTPEEAAAADREKRASMFGNNTAFNYELKHNLKLTADADPISFGAAHDFSKLPAEGEAGKPRPSLYYAQHRMAGMEWGGRGPPEPSPQSVQIAPVSEDSDATPRLIWSYARSGADWPGECAAGHMQSPIRLEGLLPFSAPPAGAPNDTSSKHTPASEELQKVAKAKEARAGSDGGTLPKGGATEDELAAAKLVLHYRPVAPGTLRLSNRGPMLEVESHGLMGHVSVGREGEIFDVLALEFHSPAEHIVGSTRYPMEMQVVHRRRQTNGTRPGDLLILSIFFDDGGEGAAYENHWLSSQLGWTGRTELPHSAQSPPIQITGTVDVSNATRNDWSSPFFFYNGSLTHPPCTQGVRWHVLQEPEYMSSEQLAGIRAVFELNAEFAHGWGNNRLLQKANGRRVLLNRERTPKEAERARHRLVTHVYGNAKRAEVGRRRKAAEAEGRRQAEQKEAVEAQASEKKRVEEHLAAERSAPKKGQLGQKH